MTEKHERYNVRQQVSCSEILRVCVTWQYELGQRQEEKRLATDKQTEVVCGRGSALMVNESGVA